MYPGTGIALQPGAEISPIYDSAGSWIQPHQHWCSTPSTASVTVSISAPNGIEVCTLVGVQPGSSTINLRLRDDTASLLVAVRTLRFVAAPPNIGASGWSWVEVASPSLAYLAEGDGEQAFFVRLNPSTGGYDQVPLDIGSSTGGAIVLNSTGTRAFAIAGDLAVRVDVGSDLPLDTLTTTPPFATTGGVYAARMGLRDSLVFVGAGGRVFAIDVHDTMTVAWDVPISGRAVWLAPAPDGTRLYVSTQDLPGGAPRHVIALDAGTGDSLRSFPVDSLVQGIAVSPDGARLFIVSEGGPIYSCPVAGSSCDSTGFGFPWLDAAISPDGSTLFAVDPYQNGVAEFDAATLHQRGWIGLKQYPSNRLSASVAAGLYVLAGGLTKVGW